MGLFSEEGGQGGHQSPEAQRFHKKRPRTGLRRGLPQHSGLWTILSRLQIVQQLR